MNLETVKHIYFLGIGGIGMSALARFFAHRGITISGYDVYQSPLCKQLEAEGMNLNYQDAIELIPENIDLVVYTPAIPSTNQQFVWFKNNAFELVKRAQLLGEISKNYFTYAVAGTHGKTTTTAMMAHLLNQFNGGVNAFIGGIANNFNSNLVLSDNKFMAIEADEFDKSFLQLRPNRLILTSLDADHLDIYGSHDQMKKTYEEFIYKLPTDGVLCVKYELNVHKSSMPFKVITYSLQNDFADVYAKNIVQHSGTYTFDIMTPYGIINDVVLNMGGKHNIENMLSVVGILMYEEKDVNLIRAGIESFCGVQRRFQYVYKNNNHIYIDDYAHHPEELKALIKSAKALFIDKKLTVVFQPHLYSRTQDFAMDFARVLDESNNIILLDIYPARELPIEGVKSEMLLGLISNENKHIFSKEALLTWIEAENPELLITAGAGDISELVTPIYNILKTKNG